MKIRNKLFALGLMMTISARLAIADTDPISFTMRLGNRCFNTLNATGSFLVISGQPRFEAVLVTPLPSREFAQLRESDYQRAVWTPYDGIVRLPLGPGDGDYEVDLGLKGDATDSRPAWLGTIVSLKRTPPEVHLTNPTNEIVSQPVLQLQGYSVLPLELARVSYDLSNAAVFVTGERCSLQGKTLDSQTRKYTRQSFQGYDIQLANGLNRLSLHATDKAGNVFITNLNVTLDYSRSIRPTIQILWPRDGLDICGDSFTLRGHTEDASSKVTASIVDTNGRATTLGGVVDRDGWIWVENIPLSGGTNVLTLSVVNSAGLSSMTNITVSRSSFVLTMEPVKDDLYLPRVTVTGVESDATYAVWVNGVKATVLVNADGTGKWIAHEVPVIRNGAVSFDMQAYAPDEQQPDGSCANGKALPLVSGSSVGSNQLAAAQKAARMDITSSVMPVQPFSLNVSPSGGTLHFIWKTVPGLTYQLQFVADLTATNWLDLGSPILAATNSVSATDTLGPEMHRFYRVKRLTN